MRNTLTRYRSKRNFSQTAEPRGGTVRSRSRSPAAPPTKIIFVIQKHSATRLHYDFRLEIDGVLKSWAVPKGLPLIKGAKTLAVMVEDHPSEYGGFEGIIPPGNYGAGTVMVWDAGICQVLESNPAAALKSGKVVFRLDGQKLHGQWALVRMRAREDGDEKAWLMIKTEENAKPISTRAEDRSILSGRTMKQIASQQDRVWESNRDAPSSRAKSAARPVRRGRRQSAN